MCMIRLTILVGVVNVSEMVIICMYIFDLTYDFWLWFDNKIINIVRFVYFLIINKVCLREVEGFYGDQVESAEVELSVESGLELKKF